MERVTDRELLRRASRGDGAAYEAFYRRHATVVHAWFRRRTGEHEAAEDLTAETFAAALCGLHRFRGERDEAAAAWLYAIASRVLGRYLQARHTQDVCLRRLGIQLERDFSTCPEHDGDEFEQAMARLPAEQQAVIRLRVTLDLDYREIGNALGCTPATARQRLGRALGRLRNQLAAEKP